MNANKWPPPSKGPDPDPAHFIIDSHACPHCCGEGEVFFAGQPYMCYPCEGTGLDVFDTDGSGPPWGYFHSLMRP